MFVVVLTSVVFATTAIVPEVVRADAQAGEAAVRFLTSLMDAERVRDVLVPADAPFVFGDEGVIEDRYDLAVAMAQVIKSEMRPSFRLAVPKVYPAAKLPAAMPDSYKRLIRQAVGEAGRVVYIKQRIDGIYVLIRVINGKMRAVGFLQGSESQ